MFDPLTATSTLMSWPASATRNLSAVPRPVAGSWPASMTCSPPRRIPIPLLPAFVNPEWSFPKKNS